MSLVFNGVDLLEEFGVHISGEATYGAPVRTVETQVVPGRDGSLLIDHGTYENVQMTYPAYIITGFHNNIRKLRDYLLSVKGYATLSDPYHDDVYYMAAYYGGLEVQTSGRGNRFGQFDLTFDRKPQRYMTAGKVKAVYTQNGTITNPTQFSSRPLITIHGGGTVNIGAYRITFDGSTSDWVNVDSDIQDAYRNGQNLNNAITLSPFEFPILPPGDTAITLGDGVSQVDIVPRWWHL